MWLLRGLNFTCTALRASHANPSEELSTSFNTSYEATLKKHHSFVVRPLFAVRTLFPCVVSLSRPARSCCHPPRSAPALPQPYIHPYQTRTPLCTDACCRRRLLSYTVHCLAARSLTSPSSGMQAFREQSGKCEATGAP